MPVADLPAAQCLPLDLEEACTLVVPQRPDQVVLPMHPYPQLVLPASPPCHPVVPAIQDLMVDLQDPDLCIQNGEVEDLGEVPATHLGQPPLRPVPWLGHQPRLALATRSKASQYTAFNHFILLNWVIKSFANCTKELL